MLISIKERIESVWVDKAIQCHPITRQILKNTDCLPVSKLSKVEIEKRLKTLSLKKGKQILVLSQLTGPMVKPCPATSKPYLCCQYRVINQGNQCPMDCTYCVLQNYLEQPAIIQYVNIESVFSEIQEIQKKEQKRFFRFGTGELADSLALDPITCLSRKWLSCFKETNNAIIELKTKSTHVEYILEESPKNAVIAWSLNPPEIIQHEELFASQLEDRLVAAKKCQDAGYILAFHFDPIICYPDWDALYKKTIDQLFDMIDWERIAWISLGSLRYPTELHRIIQKRFPGSPIPYEEMIRGMDGKMRYPRPLRTEMFKIIYQRLKQNRPDLFIYFCMESPAVWKAVTGDAPESNAMLDYWFARNVYQRFPEVRMDEPAMEYYTDRC